MKLNKVCKRVLSVTLAAALVFGTPTVLGSTGALGVRTAKAASVPTPSYRFTFEGENALQSTGSKTESIIPVKAEGATVEVVNDDAISGNHVLKISNPGETHGQNYAKLPEGIFEGATAESGVTVSMRVNIGAGSDAGSAIFCTTPAEYNQWDLFKIDANHGMHMNSSNIWTDLFPTGTPHFGYWHTVTVTFDNEYMTLYLDGDMVNRVKGVKANEKYDESKKDEQPDVPQFVDADMSVALNKIIENKFNVLGAGGFPVFEGDPAVGVPAKVTKDINNIMYDDICIYTSALTSEQVAETVSTVPTSSKFGTQTKDTIDVNGFASDQSGWEKLDGNFEIQYKFHNTTKGAQNLKDAEGKPIEESLNAYNFVFEMTDGGENWLTSRADAWDWGTLTEKMEWTTAPDWATWLADMKDMDVTVTAVREGNSLKLNYYFNALKTGNEYYLSAVTSGKKLPRTLYAHLIGEYCKLTDISLAPADQSVELGIGGSKEYKVSDILPVATVDKVNVTSGATAATGSAVEVKSDIVDVKTGTDSVTVSGLKAGTETIKVTDPVSGLSFNIKINVSDDSAPSEATPAPTVTPAPSQTPGAASGPAVSSGPAITPGEDTEPTAAPGTSDEPSTQTPAPSEPTATPDNNDGNAGDTDDDEKDEPQATTATVNKGGAKTTVKTTENGTAAVKKVKSSKKSVTVSSTVKVEGVEYKVTVIEANAFANCKKATKITLPSTVKTIKKKAFTGAKKVKTIVVKSKKAVTVKKGAFKGVDTKKVTIKASKMSKKQLKKFKKTLKKAGFKGKVKK